MSAKVEVEIAGQRLTIRSDEPAEYIRGLAAGITAEVAKLRQGPTRDPAKALALVALSLADRLLREQDLHDRLRRTVTDGLDHLAAAQATHHEHLEALLRGGAAPDRDPPP